MATVSYTIRLFISLPTLPIHTPEIPLNGQFHSPAVPSMNLEHLVGRPKSHRSCWADCRLREATWMSLASCAVPWGVLPPGHRTRWCCGTEGREYSPRLSSRVEVGSPCQGRAWCRQPATAFVALLPLSYHGCSLICVSPSPIVCCPRPSSRSSNPGGGAWAFPHSLPPASP
jgi:hypothetical protein